MTTRINHDLHKQVVNGPPIWVIGEETVLFLFAGKALALEEKAFAILHSATDPSEQANALVEIIEEYVTETNQTVIEMQNMIIDPQGPR